MRITGRTTYSLSLHLLARKTLSLSIRVVKSPIFHSGVSCMTQDCHVAYLWWVANLKDTRRDDIIFFLPLITKLVKMFAMINYVGSNLLEYHYGIYTPVPIK